MAGKERDVKDMEYNTNTNNNNYTYYKARIRREVCAAIAVKSYVHCDDICHLDFRTRMRAECRRPNKRGGLIRNTTQSTGSSLRRSWPWCSNTNCLRSICYAHNTYVASYDAAAFNDLTIQNVKTYIDMLPCFIVLDLDTTYNLATHGAPQTLSRPRSGGPLWLPLI